jgi:hypothetical protein
MDVAELFSDTIEVPVDKLERSQRRQYLSERGNTLAVHEAYALDSGAYGAK